MNGLSINVVEIIPYENFKDMIRITKTELNKNRHVEIWDKYKYIYSAEKWYEQK